MAKKKRINTYFRQTAKSFKAAKQTQIFSHINRNLPYRIYGVVSQKLFAKNIRRLKSGYNKIKTKLPKDAKKIK